MTTSHEALEAHYQRSAEDPASAEMLTVWEAAWKVAMERAAKIADDKTERINSKWIARDIAAAIRAQTGGEHG